MHVLIAGGGIGGLCLAQGLRRRGIGVTVLERDPSSDARFQGLRLRIDSLGRAALAECLPGSLYDLVLATANKLYMSRGVALNKNLEEISSESPVGLKFDPATASTVVNRRTLRQVLLTGIEDDVHFGCAVDKYEVSGDRVIAHTKDGNSWVGDVLVGADGINSTVRRQLLPEAELIDTDLRAIYGQLPLDDETLSWLPGAIFGGSRPVLGPDRVTLAIGVFQSRTPFAEAVTQCAPHARLDDVQDYLKWTLVAPREAFPASEREMFEFSGPKLHRIACDMTSTWSPIIGRIMAESVAESSFSLAIKASSPGTVWSPSRVTVLGDSVHATTPVGGTGANTALRDAALLCRRLASSGPDIVESIGLYEDEMRRYGYDAVTTSLWGAERIFRSRSLVNS